MSEEETFKQYSIAGFKENAGKWYREGKFKDIEGAKHYYKHHSKDFKKYSKLKIQSRIITKWVDESEVNWLDE